MLRYLILGCAVQDIALGHDYLDKHNVRYLMVELGLRTMRQRPSEVAGNLPYCAFFQCSSLRDSTAALPSWWARTWQQSVIE